MEPAQSQRIKGRRIFRSASFLLFILVPLLSLVAIQPILTGILPWRGDGLLHLVRLAELERAVRVGVLFPRWSPGLGYGFGFPLFHYYAPFSYYVGLMPRLVGFSLPVSLALSYVGALSVLGWGVALWAKDVWRDWLGVLTAVFATLYAPYILYNSYHRAALAELWGLAWLVLVLWAVNRAINDFGLMIDDSSRTKFGVQIPNLIFIAVFYGLLILSHNITAMIGTPLIVGYAIFLLIGKRPFNLQSFGTLRTGSLIFIILGLLLGLGLSAFFWLPAFFERDLVQIENLTATSGFTYRNHFLTWIEVLAWPQTAVPLQVNPPIPRSLSWPVVALAILAWLPIKRLKIEGLKVQRLGLTIAALVCLLMVLPWSQPLWEAIGLLAFVQFPWRFLGPVSIFLAMLAGLGAMQLFTRRSSEAVVNRPKFHYLLFVSVTSLILLFALPWLFPSRAHTLPTDMSPAATIQFEVETGWLGTTAAADYLPRDVQALPVPDNGRSGLTATQLADGLRVQDWVMDFTSVRFNYESDAPVPMVFHQFLFPGWQAVVDDVPVELVPSDPEGLITAVLPTGEHIFELTFGSTPLRRAAHVISVVSSITLLALIMYAVSHKSESRATPQFTLHSPRFIIYVLASVLLIFTLKTLLLDHTNSPFRTTHMSVQSSTASSAINFGSIIQLLGAEIPHEPIPADQTIDITLYWQTVPPVSEEYSVSVQMIGENGRRIAQSDSFHPAGLPLPRWQAGEYGLDTHQLTPLPATPPGEYELVVFVYDTDTGERLEVLNEGGLPIGNEFSLGEIILVEPTEFPNPSDLDIGKRETEGGGQSPFLAEDVQLLGYDAPLADMVVGEMIPLTLYWHTPQTPAKDYKTNIQVNCENGVQISSVAASQAAAPNTNWQPGQLQRTEFDVPLRPVDETGKLLQAGFCTLYLSLSANGEVNSIALETFEITVPERLFALPKTAVPLYTISFLNDISLAGFTLNQTGFLPGETIPLTLYWHPSEMVDTSYKVFVQFLDDSSRLVAQKDQIPANGTRPTTGWVPGEFVQDDYALVLPSDVAPGSYHLITGLYNAATGDRLPLADGSGDAITIPVSIEVKTAE